MTDKYDEYVTNSKLIKIEIAKKTGRCQTNKRTNKQTDLEAQKKVNISVEKQKEMIAGRLTGRLTIRGHTQASTKNEKEAL